MAGKSKRVATTSDTASGPITGEDSQRVGHFRGLPTVSTPGLTTKVTDTATSLLPSQSEESGGRARKPAKGGAVEDPALYKRFRRLCDSILSEVRELEASISEGRLPDDWLGSAAEIEALLEQLYDVPWGQRDALKGVVTAILFQVVNADWHPNHVMFLKDMISRLRSRYSIDQTAVKECAESVRLYELDQFRGTATKPMVRTHYKIVEDTGE
ncbi:MAG: hypothetical protein JWO38_6288 [Gemmataceae bacterium]|nr:hypothetical protein [Gemmataceae bacterium]